MQRRIAGINHDIERKIEDLLQNTGRNIEHQTHPGRNALKIPNVRHRRRQLNVAHALTAHLIFCNLDAAALANFSFITDTFIFSAVAFPVLCRAKDTLAKQAVALRLQGAVVDCFRLFDLTVGPFADLFGRCQTDFDGFKGDIFHRTITCLSFWFYAGKWGVKPN